jgi:F420H(2)-dependent quinone reductase
LLTMRDVTARRLSRLHRGIYRLTRGRVGKRLVRNDMLLLTTTGARSGKPHTVPLLYLRDGDTLVVIASWGGRPYHPDWYHNLLAHPVATVRVRSRTWDVRARTAVVEVVVGSRKTTGITRSVCDWYSRYPW